MNGREGRGGRKTGGVEVNGGTIGTGFEVRGVGFEVSRVGFEVSGVGFEGIEMGFEGRGV